MNFGHGGIKQFSVESRACLEVVLERTLQRNLVNRVRELDLEMEKLGYSYDMILKAFIKFGKVPVSSVILC